MWREGGRARLGVSSMYELKVNRSLLRPTYIDEPRARRRMDGHTNYELNVSTVDQKFRILF